MSACSSENKLARLDTERDVVENAGSVLQLTRKSDRVDTNAFAAHKPFDGGAVQEDLVRADEDLVAVLELGDFHPLPVYEGPAFCVLVVDHPPVVGPSNTRMNARDLRIVDYQVVLREPADRHFATLWGQYQERECLVLKLLRISTPHPIAEDAGDLQADLRVLSLYRFEVGLPETPEVRIRGCDNRGRTRGARNNGHFAEEFARSKMGKYDLLGLGVRYDAQVTAGHDVHLIALVALSEDRSAGLHCYGLERGFNS